MIRCVRIWTGADGNSDFEEGGRSPADAASVFNLADSAHEVNQPERTVP